MNDADKQCLQHELVSRLMSIPSVLSVTLVGSFVDREDLSGVSDIDTIVICQKLNESIFNQCIETTKQIPLDE